MVLPNMASKLLNGRSLNNVKAVLSERLFSQQQIEKIIPRLHEQHIKEPKYLAEIVDTWNRIMRTQDDVIETGIKIPPLAQAPKNSLMGQHNIDMRNILADIEPDLLLFDPKKLTERHNKVMGLGVAYKKSDLWLLLFYSARGFYLQDWIELTKKIYYIENKIIPMLYDKKTLQTMNVSPITKQAYVVEAEFDHIRARYLFAHRSGFDALSHLFRVQTALDRQTIGDLIMSDSEKFLKEFAPYCSIEEYKSFENLIKQESFDDDDAEIYERLAELNETRHNKAKRFSRQDDSDDQYT